MSGESGDANPQLPLRFPLFQTGTKYNCLTDTSMHSLSTLATELLLLISDDHPLDALCSPRATYDRFCDLLTPRYISSLYSAYPATGAFPSACPPLYHACEVGNLPLTLSSSATEPPCQNAQLKLFGKTAVGYRYLMPARPRYTCAHTWTTRAQRWK
jgi:hypothetical protein